MSRTVLLFALLVLPVLTASARGWTVQISLPTGPPSVVVVVMMENMSINQTYGRNCPGNCSYITQLANTYSLAESYSAISHPSLVEYLGITSGGNYDYPPFSNSCYPQSTGCSIAVPSIVDSVEASGRTWKAYMEDYTGGGCTRQHNNDALNAYTNSHNPFLYYNRTYGSPSRCARIVNANPGAEGFLALPSLLISDLNNATRASNFMWLTPNLCNDGHSTCSLTSSNSTGCPSASLPQCGSQANQYLSMLVPKILNSLVFTTQNAALFITWDEGTANYPRDYVTATWAGPTIQPGHKSSVFYTHYSLPATLEGKWAMPPLTTHDASANRMNEFFTGSGTIGGTVVPKETPDSLIQILLLAILLTPVLVAGRVYLKEDRQELERNSFGPDRCIE